MMLSQITAEAGAHQRRKRVGRGEASGHGKTCGRGNKGCNSRAGGGTRPLHEGGQMPIFRRLPKRGFSNFEFTVRYAPVNLGTLEAHFASGATVDAEALRKAGLVPAGQMIKVLGAGALTKKLTVVANAFSAAAKEAIEKAGGTATLIPRRNRAESATAKRNTAKKNKPAKPKRPARAAEAGAAAESGSGGAG